MSWAKSKFPSVPLLKRGRLGADTGNALAESLAVPPFLKGGQGGFAFSGKPQSGGTS